MAKEIQFRGKELSEINSMSIKEFSQLLSSRERRKINRGFTEPEKKLIEKAKKKDFIKTHCRDMIVLPVFVGKKIAIYNGKEFVSIQVTSEMLGHRLGEFVPTRKPVKHNSPGIGATKSTAHASVK